MTLLQQFNGYTGVTAAIGIDPGAKGAINATAVDCGDVAIVGSLVCYCPRGLPSDRPQLVCQETICFPGFLKLQAKIFGPGQIRYTGVEQDRAVVVWPA